METATHMLRTGQGGALFQLQMALRDLRNSFQRIGLAWSLLAVRAEPVAWVTSTIFSE